MREPTQVATPKSITEFDANLVGYAALLLLCIGCSPDAVSTADGPSRRDSAGIEIVTNRAIEGSPMIVAFDSTFIVDFGGMRERPEEELAPRASHDLVHLANGNWVLTNGRQIRLYSPEGLLLRALGSAGEGPGQFSGSIWAACAISPSQVLALEVPAPRIGRTSIEFDSLSTIVYSGVALGRGCVADGFIARTSTPTLGLPDGPVASHAVIGVDGVALRSIGVLPADDYAAFFPHEAAVAGSPTGVVAGSGTRYEYRQYTPAGQLYRIVRTADVERSIGRDEAADIARSRLGTDMPEARQRELVEEAIGGRSRIAVPAYQRLIVDEKGRVWISEIRKTGGPLELWAVFDSTGKLLGRADPNEITMLGEGRKLVTKWLEQGVVVRHTDSLGAPRVSVIGYVIRKP